MIIQSSSRSYLEVERRSHLQEAVVFKVLRNDNDCLFHTRLFRMDVDLWILWCLIRCTNTGEFLDLASLSLLIQALWISLFRLLDWNIDEDFDEWKW